MDTVSTDICLKCDAYKGKNNDNTIKCAELNNNFESIVVSAENRVCCPRLIEK